MRSIILALIIITFLFSCRKENHNEPICNGIKPSSNPNGYENVISDTLYLRPCYNPRNSDELIFGKNYHDYSGLQLSYCNTKLHIQKSFNLSFTGKASLSSTGWIVFAGIDDLRLWRMKLNGDSLMRVTNSTDGEEHDPTWSPDGSHLLYYRYANSDFGEVLLDANGSNPRIIDTQYYFFAPSWSPDGSKISFYTQGNERFFGYYDLNSGKITRLLSEEATGVWCRDSKWIIAIKRDGIYKVNSQTKEIIKIKDACNYHSYQYPTLSSDGKTILAECDDFKQTGPNKLLHSIYICRMDSMGRNEEEVKF